jgi:hypothetical protein
MTEFFRSLNEIKHGGEHYKTWFLEIFDYAETAGLFPLISYHFLSFSRKRHHCRIGNYSFFSILSKHGTVGKFLSSAIIIAEVARLSRAFPLTLLVV